MTTLVKINIPITRLTQLIHSNQQLQWKWKICIMNQFSFITHCILYDIWALYNFLRIHTHTYIYIYIYIVFLLQAREIEHNNLIYRNRMPFHSNICVCCQPMVCIPPWSKSFFVLFWFSFSFFFFNKRKKKAFLYFLE